MKDSFINKLTELDFLIEDKEKKLEELNSDVLNKQNIISELEEKIEEIKNNESKQSASDDVVLPKYADFEDGNLLSNYKIIKRHFDIDANKVISEFIDKIDDNSDDIYNYLTRIRKYFSYDVIYRISSFPAKDQLTIVDELLDEKDKEYIKDLFNVKRFNIKRFVDSIDDLLIRNNPKIYIYVGDHNNNYDQLDGHIQTIYDDKITEGFKIVYKGIVYDFSI